jgi:hypothetical protein
MMSRRHSITASGLPNARSKSIFWKRLSPEGASPDDSAWTELLSGSSTDTAVFDPVAQEAKTSSEKSEDTIGNLYFRTRFISFYSPLSNDSLVAIC